MESECLFLFVSLAIFACLLDVKPVEASSSRVRYAIPAPDTGCADKWAPLSLKVSYHNLTRLTVISERFDISFHVVGNDSSNIAMRFCMWDSDDDHEIRSGVTVDDFGKRDLVSFTSLPEGSYCVYSIGEARANFNKGRWDWTHGTCPSGFQSGFSTFPFNTTFELTDKSKFKDNPWPIPSPFSLFHVNNSSVHYCCTGKGQANRSVDLPFVTPFILFPYKSSSCQRVRGMRESLQFIVWPAMRYDGGMHPFINDTQGGGNKFYYCYYEPDTLIMETNIKIATFTVMIGTPVVTFLVMCACRYTHRKLRKRKKQRQSLLAAGYVTATSDVPVSKAGASTP